MCSSAECSDGVFSSHLPRVSLLGQAIGFSEATVYIKTDADDSDDGAEVKIRANHGDLEQQSSAQDQYADDL
jgi:hypothetical protein